MIWTTVFLDCDAMWMDASVWSKSDYVMFFFNCHPPCITVWSDLYCLSLPLHMHARDQWDASHEYSLFFPVRNSWSVLHVRQARAFMNAGACNTCRSLCKPRIFVLYINRDVQLCLPGNLWEKCSSLVPGAWGIAWRGQYSVHVFIILLRYSLFITFRKVFRVGLIFI